jgi:hypothetical protein
MKTSISKYTAQEIERILNELLAEDEFDSLIVEIKSSEYMGDVKERECVDISWLDHKNRGRDFVQSVISRVLAEEEEDFDKGWIVYTSDYDTYMPIIVRGLDGTRLWRAYKSWCASGIEEEETKFDCTCHSWMIAIEDEDEEDED